MLRSVVLQRIRHDLMTTMNNEDVRFFFLRCKILKYPNFAKLTL